MVEDDPQSIRESIERYTEDENLQMLFKAIYLLGATQCEMLGDQFPSDSKSHVYAPTGNDVQEVTVEANNVQIDTVFFKIRTARTQGKEERTVWLPMDCEPWAKQLYDYFKSRGDNPVFPIKRQDIFPKMRKSKVLDGLARPISYTGVTKWKPWRLDDLRGVRERELVDKFNFKEEHLKAYGLKKINKLKAPDNLLDDSRINELKKDYLWKLCNPKAIEETGNIIFLDGIRIDVNKLIENHENEEVEFKCSLCYDYDKKNKYWVPEMAVARAVASFLNSSGGFVLIGVKDDKTILGLEKDFDAIHNTTEDAFRLHFNAVIANYLGLENTQFVKVRFSETDGKKIAVVISEKAPKEVLLTEGKTPHLYMRSGNSSRELNVKEAIEYVSQHWNWKKESNHA